MQLYVFSPNRLLSPWMKFILKPPRQILKDSSLLSRISMSSSAPSASALVVRAMLRVCIHSSFLLSVLFFTIFI